MDNPSKSAQGRQVKSIDEKLPFKSQLASCLFMGLGQAVYLHQYVRGAHGGMPWKYSGKAAIRRRRKRGTGSQRTHFPSSA